MIAKGARRPRSRFGAALEPFRRLRVTYYEKTTREIQTLSQVELVEDYSGIVTSLERLEAAGGWLRFLRSVLPDGAPAEELFRLATDALRALSSTPEERTRRWETYFRAAAASRLGIAPQLDGCSSCGRELPDGGPVWFSVESGGLLCASCSRDVRDCRRLDSRQFALLVLFHHPEYKLVKSMEVIDTQERKVYDIIHNFIAFHTGLRPMSVGQAGSR